MATLRRLRPAIPVLLAVTFVATGAAAVLAADPTGAPGAGTATRPTCAERYAEDGPAGVDLRLGCVIGEVVGQYTGTVAGDATPASTYGLVILAAIVGIVVAAWLVGRLVRRAAGRRLAPVRPSEWWLCAACRSVNGAGVQHCYACGATRADGPALRADEAPSTAQSFGTSRKRG